MNSFCKIFDFGCFMEEINVKKSLLIVLMCVIMCISACSSGLILCTPERIAEVFYANEECFNTAAETITAYDNNECRIYITPIKEKTRESLSVVKEINGLYFSSTDTMTDLDYQALYDVYAPLFATLEGSCSFTGVAMYDSRVQFVLEGPIYGEAAELYYFPDADFGAYYMSQIKGALQIDAHWYAEIAYY